MKTLVFVVSIAAFLVGVECSNQITLAMLKHDVIPDVVFNGAESELLVSYGYVNVFLGNELTPTETKDKPDFVDWNADENAFHTLIFTAPDGPSRAKPTFREVIKWLVVNIPGCDIENGEVLADYIGAGPEKKAGLGRFVFLVYKQKGKQKFDEKRIDKYSFAPRKNFSTRKFIQKYEMGPESVAADLFQARYDDYVPILYKQIHYNESV